MLKIRYVSVIAMLFLMATPALADDSADCKQTADPSLAIQACGKVIAAKKSKDDLVAAYAARGDGYLAKKDYDNAVSDYSEILTIDPTKTVAALTMRGNAYLANDNWHFALADLTSALKMTPQDASLYASRSKAYQEKGDAANADSDSKQAHQLDPNAGC
jgi:tetratricopeptide (TPR) repeat protein